MKFIFSIVVLFLYSLCSFAQQPKLDVLRVRHQFTNISANHFPNYFSNKQVETYLLNEIGRKLVAHFQADEVILPAFVEVVRADRFISRRIREVSSEIGDNVNLKVEIFSLLTKETNSFNKIWVFDIVVHSGEETVLSKRIFHNLVPYSATAYLTQVRWLSQQEFAHFFLRSIDELLGTNPIRESPIRLGNDQYVNNLIESNIPQFKTSIFTANGAYILGGNVSFAIDGKEERLVSFNYSNRGWRARKNENFDQQSAAVLEKVMGTPPSGKIVRTLMRNGTFNFSDTLQRRVRYDRIYFESKAGAQTAPDFLQLYEGEKLNGRFYFFSKQNNDAAALYGYRDEGSFGWGDMHFLQGELNNKFYVVEFDEQLGLISFMSETETEAIILLQNLNPNSRVFGGLALSGDNTRITVRNPLRPNIDASDAEWYGLFTRADADEKDLEAYAQLYALLFFALASN